MIIRPQNCLVQISRRVSKYAEFYADFKSNEKVENFPQKKVITQKICVIRSKRRKQRISFAFSPS
jgi:hypothetical protein